MEIYPVPTTPVDVLAPSFEKLKADAAEWARAAGLKPPFDVNGPEKQGFSYAVQVQEKNLDPRIGKCRLGTAKFTLDGKPSMWTVDGIVTG